ncbi:MAG: outer membrane beta-barrel protein [Opitutales bacterium]|nr:outer membrane beta-barrel protein [Opitutales bacterium]
MRLKGLYILISYLAHFTICFSQGQTAVLSRNEIFDRMEARAKSLAQRMDEMSGNSNRVSSPAPRATDSNPSSFSPPPPSSELIIEGGGASPTVNPFHSESQIVESTDGFSNEVDDNMDYLQIESAQEILGDYYILPSFGFVLSSESTVHYNYQANYQALNVVKDLDNEMGYVVGMRAGVRFANFFTEFGIKYSSLDYKATGIESVAGFFGSSFNLNYDAVGSADILNFNAKLGYSFPINEVLSFNSSVGLGLSNRRNDFDILAGVGGNILFTDSISSSETVLSYDLAFSIAYYHAESYQVSLGYNYMNVAKISQFDALDLHYFELGLGLNF